MDKALACSLAIIVSALIFSFDLLVSSLSAMLFRLMYDIAFGIISLVFTYVAILLILGEDLPRKGASFVFPKLLAIIPIILNINAVISILWLDVPSIGFLLEDILAQAATGLLPLLSFIVLSAANAIILYLNIHRKTAIQLLEIPAYLLAVIAIETSLSVYAFHFYGLNEIRCILSLIHIAFIILTFRVYRSLSNEELCLRISLPELLLTLLSTGIFMMVYVPFGLYNLYGDNAVVLGSALSITERGSLQPYYAADNYYSPIMGFVTVIFSYTTGFGNLLLASNLPFLIASMALPFVTYHFIKSFITDDSRIAIVATIAAVLMDGPAVILLPPYVGKITTEIINWRISPLTKSLYATNICQLWLTPYKSFANASAIAACSIVYKKRTASFLLSGTLFFMSLANPRYSILSVLLFLLLLGIKKVNAKELSLFALSAIISSGLTLQVHLYKELTALSESLYSIGLINEALLAQFTIFLKYFARYEALPLFSVIIFIAFLGIFALTSLNSAQKQHEDNNIFVFQFSPRKIPEITTKTGEREFSSIDILVLGSIFSIFIYAVFHVYSLVSIINFTENPFIADLNTVILRYHILIVFFAVGFLTLKYDKRTAFTAIMLLTSFFLGGRLAKSISLFPLIFTILALPLFAVFVKQTKKKLMCIFLILVFLGVFSSTLYSATVAAPEITDYNDLPQVLHILLEYNEGTDVYSPSFYTYYARRISSMAQMRFSHNKSSSLYLIDKNYFKSELLKNFIKNENFTVLYDGNRFTLLKRVN